MKKTLMACWILLVAGCSTGFDPDLKSLFTKDLLSFNYDGNPPPKNELAWLIEDMVAEMLSNNQFVGKQNAIAVTSIVNLTNLAETNRFGHQITEGIIHYLHSNGFRVVDFKLTGTIQVTPEGDFIHSRDWEELKGEQSIDYLVSGTLDQYDSGLYISVRMVGLQSQVVVASSQAFVSAEQVQSFTSKPEELILKEKEQQEKIAMLEKEQQEKIAMLEKENTELQLKTVNETINETINSSMINNRKVSMANGLLIRNEQTINN
jgi:TolB-like protein